MGSNDWTLGYRIYVLFVLLMVCISNLATRNLASYLVTVPVPECVEVCAGVPSPSLCEVERPRMPAQGATYTRAQMCQLCRANLGWIPAGLSTQAQLGFRGPSGHEPTEPPADSDSSARAASGDAADNTTANTSSLREVPAEPVPPEEASQPDEQPTASAAETAPHDEQPEVSAAEAAPSSDDHNISVTLEEVSPTGSNATASDATQPQRLAAAAGDAASQPNASVENVTQPMLQGVEARVPTAQPAASDAAAPPAAARPSVAQQQPRPLQRQRQKSPQRSPPAPSPGITNVSAEQVMALSGPSGTRSREEAATPGKTPGLNASASSRRNASAEKVAPTPRLDASEAVKTSSIATKDATKASGETTVAPNRSVVIVKVSSQNKTTSGVANSSSLVAVAGKRKRKAKHKHHRAQEGRRSTLIQKTQGRNDARALRHGRRKHRGGWGMYGSRTSGSSNRSILRRHKVHDRVPGEDNYFEVRDAGFFNMSDGVCMARWEYGLLAGYGFAIVFALGSAVAGYICDRKPRVAVASVAVSVWSVALSMQASAHTFSFLFMCRGVIGLAQAFAMPAAITIAADYFPERQSVAEVVLSLGLYLGSGSASFSIVLAEAMGWRWVTLLAGLGGLLIAALLYFTVEEPERSEWSAPCSQAVVIYEVFDKSRVARMLLMAASAKMLAACSLSAFLPLWYSRAGLIGYTSGRYAVWNMLAISVGGVLSAIVGGFVSNIWSRRDPRAPCWVGVFGSLASMPLICVVIRTSYFSASITCLFLLLVVSESWFGPTVGLLQASTRRSVRGQAVSMFLVASTLVAYMGPAIVGFLDPGDADLGTSLLWVALLANAVSVVAFIWTAREVGVDPVAADAGYKFEPEAQVSRSRPGRPGAKQSLVPPRGTTPWFFF